MPSTTAMTLRTMPTRTALVAATNVPDAKAPVTLEIYASSAELVWKFSSDEEPEKVDENALTYPARHDSGSAPQTPKSARHRAGLPFGPRPQHRSQSPVLPTSG